MIHIHDVEGAARRAVFNETLRFKSINREFFFNRPFRLWLLSFVEKLNRESPKLYVLDPDLLEKTILTEAKQYVYARVREMAHHRGDH